MKSNKVFIVLSSIFLGLAVLALIFEFYSNFECMRLVYKSSQEQSSSFGEAIGKAVGISFIYIITIMVGIISAGFAIPVIPFSVVMLRRVKNAPYAIAFLICATVVIVVAIGVMFILPLASHNSAASSAVSSLSSSY